LEEGKAQEAVEEDSSLGGSEKMEIKDD